VWGRARVGAVIVVGRIARHIVIGMWRIIIVVVGMLSKRQPAHCRQANCRPSHLLTFPEEEEVFRSVFFLLFITT
jgi:hypothetical protein